MPSSLLSIPTWGRTRAKRISELWPRTYASRKTLGDRKSTRLNSSHLGTSYAVFCLKTKTPKQRNPLSTVTAEAIGAPEVFQSSRSGDSLAVLSCGSVGRNFFFKRSGRHRVQPPSRADDSAS